MESRGGLSEGSIARVERGRDANDLDEAFLDFVRELPDPALVADDEARYIEANAAACVLLGYDREELLRLRIWDVTPVPDAATALELWAAFLRERKQSGDFNVRRKNGSQVPVEFRAIAGVRPGMHVSILRDLSNRAADSAIRDAFAARAEAALKTAELARSEERLREAIRRKDDFLAMVSHDLRNPIGVVAMNATLLAQHVPTGEIGDRMRKWLDATRRAADMMSRLVNDLLDGAAIEHGRLVVKLERHEASVLAQQALEDMLPVAARKGVWLEAELPPGPLAVACDRERVLQVLGNLLGNAIKFTPSGGQITLRVASASDAIEVSVADSGAGMPPEMLTHVFKPYWQARPGDRRGVGLGLFIAKGIVQAHGGKISLESAVGRGTTVRFTLPRQGT